VQLSIENIIIQLIIAIFLFLIVYRIFNKWIVSLKRKVLAIVACLALTPFIYLGILYLFFFAISYEPDRDFSKETWMREPFKRYYMADDLINHKILNEKDSNTIKQLLGAPDVRRPQVTQWEYGMGEGSGGLGFMFHSLIINFDSNYRVKSAFHGQLRD